MSTGFPISLDTYTVKNNGDTLQPAHVNDIQDAVSALEAKVGVDGSSVATSHTKKIADLVTLLGSCTAADLQKLHDLTATALELNIMDGVTATAAELNILDGVTATAAELNILDGVTGSTAEINAAVNAIKAATTRGDLLVKGASVIERLAAVAATQYLKSAGTSTNPAYSKLALRDTGVKVVQQSIDIGFSGYIGITGVGFQPSVAIILGEYDEKQLSIGFDAISTRGAIRIFGGTELTVNGSSSRSIYFSGGPQCSFSSFNDDGGVIDVPISSVRVATLNILFLP